MQFGKRTGVDQLNRLAPGLGPGHSEAGLPA